MPAMYTNPHIHAFICREVIANCHCAIICYRRDMAKAAESKGEGKGGVGRESYIRIYMLTIYKLEKQRQTHETNNNNNNNNNSSCI